MLVETVPRSIRYEIRKQKYSNVTITRIFIAAKQRFRFRRVHVASMAYVVSTNEVNDVSET